MKTTQLLNCVVKRTMLAPKSLNENSLVYKLLEVKYLIDFKVIES
jgi:hypothetical protein